ncbi:MAG: LysR family transcriptional regulator [Chloroflexota bacterium]
MNLNQLEVLIAIVKTGSLKEAAEIVGLTHSAVSYSLSNLEAELGVTLMERGRRGIKLTPVGEKVLEHAHRVISEIEIIRQETARERGVTSGKIRFGCVSQVPARFLTGIIRSFQSQYPDVEVVLFQGSSIEIVDWMEQRVVDVGTVVNPEDYPLAIKLVENPMIVILPTNHPLAVHDTVRMDMLHGETFIGTRNKTDETVAEVTSPKIPTLHMQHQVTETNTLFAMVAEGMGIAILPAMLAQDDLEGIVIKRLHPPTTMQAFLATNAVSPVTQAFLTVAHNWTRNHNFLLKND